MSVWDYVIIGVSIVVILAICVLLAVKLSKATIVANKLDEPNLNSISAATGYLSEKEFVFYKTLKNVAESLGFIVFPKVELCNIVFSKNDKLKNHKAFHTCVDFCIFTDYEFRPILVVDLFDNTISDQQLSEIEVFATKALMSSNIPILKQQTEGSYNMLELKERIQESISVTSRKVIEKKISE